VFILAQKSTKDILEASGRRGSNGPSSETVFINNHNRTGIDVSDMSYFYIDEIEDIEIVNRIENGDSYNLIWDENLNITGLDFSPQDSKPYIKIELLNGKNEFKADGIDSCSFRLSVLDKDLNLFPYNGSVHTNVMRPDGGNVRLRLTFIDGICEKTITTKVTGIWTIPSEKPIIFKLLPKFDNIVLKSYTDGDLL
jgi:hypothetical protein